MKKTSKGHVINEQDLNKLINDTIADDIAQNQVTHFQVNQAHFEQLWSQAELKSFKHPKVTRAPSVRTRSNFSLFLSPWQFTFALMICASLFIMFGGSMLRNQQGSIVIKPVVPDQQTRKLIAQASSYLTDNNDEEDYLSWLDHDDWNLNPDF